MYPSPEVVLNPTVESTVEPNSSTLFLVCAVTRAQARKLRDVVDLSDSFMSASDTADSSSQTETIELVKDTASVCKDKSAGKRNSIVELMPDENVLNISIDREELIKAQKSDPTLSSCFYLAALCEKTVPYLVDDGVTHRFYARVGNPGRGASTVSFQGANFGS